MTFARLGSLLVTLLVLATALAGCHGLDHDGEGGTPSPSPTSTDGPNATASPRPTATGTPPPVVLPDVELQITVVPNKVAAGEDATINVTVEGDEVEASFAGLAYSFNSTEPIPPANLTTDDFNGTEEGNGNVSFPGRYSVVDWTLDFTSDKVFVRAYIIVDDSLFWSDESVIAVTQPQSPVIVDKIHSAYIDYRSQKVGPVETRVPDPQELDCESAKFYGNGGITNPSHMTITMDEGIVWVNSDENKACVHNVVSTEGPTQFKTKDLAHGETSDVIPFPRAGDYKYKCEYHPEMTGTIKVNPKI